ncbi:unnamed protein product [Ceratitis capitata]|uniref:(Mediterranean fruit fly) hypothetical protein n=1 Tax=Ceratitis capitata TaxID=7213 RepID=A0A811UFP9_CERCA|nr:unnamed protein product [Ceratitis capitata]
MASQSLVTLQHNNFLIGMFAFVIFASLVFSESLPTQNMSRKERTELRNEARDMFNHAYTAYMNNAYPADELMPLSCKGRYRGITPSRGDMDDILGKYELFVLCYPF